MFVASRVQAFGAVTGCEVAAPPVMVVIQVTGTEKRTCRVRVDSGVSIHNKADVSQRLSSASVFLTGFDADTSPVRNYKIKHVSVEGRKRLFTATYRRTHLIRDISVMTSVAVWRNDAAIGTSYSSRRGNASVCQQHIQY